MSTSGCKQEILEVVPLPLPTPKASGQEPSQGRTMLQGRDRGLVEVTQSLSRPGHVCVTPRVALTLCPARAQPGAVLAPLVLMLLFPEPGSSQGRGLPEEGIIHFQECLNHWELLESSSGLGVFPQHWTALSIGAGEAPGTSSWCPPG